MIKKFLYASFIATALIFATSATGFAQTAQTRGVVTMQQADGKTVPVQGALVDAYRSDITQKKPQTAKTNKKGEFVFAGLMLGATYTISTSAASASPDVFAGVRAGQEDIAITLRAGDGKRLAFDELKQGATAPTATTPTAATGTATPTVQPNADAKPRKESAEEKKAREEIEKKNAEIIEKNRKVQGADKIIQQSIKEGDAAFDAGRKAREDKKYDDSIAQYTTAITKYDEGYKADPEYVESAARMLTSKSKALTGIGIIHYNNASNNKDVPAKTAGLESAKKDFQSAYDAADQAVQFFKNPATLASSNPKAIEIRKYEALSQRAEAARLLVKTDQSKVSNTVTAFQEYIAVETDPKKKAEAQLTAADTALGAGDIDSAATQYKAILAQDPSNTKVLSKLGFALTSSEDKAKLQEGVEYLQQFINVAPDSDPDKGYAKATLEELKNQQKIVPTKTAGKSGKKKS